MTKMQCSSQLIRLSCSLSLTLLCCTPVHAQLSLLGISVQRSTLNFDRQADKRLIFNIPSPPPDIGRPKTDTGGGSRGCRSESQEKPLSSAEEKSAEEKRLAALVPKTGWGLTTAKQPTFWFYVPYSSSLFGEFVLMDEADQTVYQTPFTLGGTPGIVSLSLPSTVEGLEIGKRYHWYFNIYCQPEQPPFFVDGWIERVELKPEIKTQLENATPKERVTLYAENGIWYEALTTSAELRRADPQNAEWTTLLQTVGWENIASEPIVACCQPRK